MALEIEMTGSGTIGDIVPGWNVSEYATPSSVNNYAGGVGAVNFSAKANNDSLFVLNNKITSTNDAASDSISGYVNSVSQTGMGVSISHGNKFSAYDAERNIPPIYARSTASALDLCTQLVGKSSLNKTHGVFYSMAGHNTGFYNELVNNSTYNTVIAKPSYNSSTISFNDGWYAQQWVNKNFVLSYSAGYKFNTGIDNVINMYANFTEGDTFNVSGDNTNTVFFKAYGDTDFSFRANSYTSPTTYDSIFSVAVNRATATITVSATINYNEILSIPGDVYTSSSVLTSGLAANEEYVVMVRYIRDYGFAASLIKPDGSDSAIASFLITAPSNSYQYFPWTINSTARAIWIFSENKPTIFSSLDYTYSDYEVKNYVIASTRTTSQMSFTASGIKKNMWQYIQDAAAVCREEIVILNDTITVRAMSTNVLNIDNFSSVPSISPSSTLTGRSIDIEYTNSERIISDEIYSAYDEDDSIISVSTGKVTKVKVQTNSYFEYFYQPALNNSFPTMLGAYSIVDNAGVPVPELEWSDYGGELLVEINADNSTILDVTLTGPRVEIPAHAGPYKMAISDGTNDYPALSIWGWGVKNNVKTLSLTTGVDTTKVSQTNASSVSNVFINTIADAYDIGAPISSAASGPNVKFSASISAAHIPNFGFAPGAIISYHNSKYRVDDVQISNLNASFNASRYVTVADFENVWLDKIVGTHDIEWENYEVQDHFIAPLSFAENIIVNVFSDIDGNPYFSSLTEDAYVILFDDDGNPYISYTEDDPNAVLLYLDSDFSPYY
jgi:hypothetical protein